MNIAIVDRNDGAATISFKAIRFTIYGSVTLTIFKFWRKKKVGTKFAWRHHFGPENI
jgi:hypothetical protein